MDKKVLCAGCGKSGIQAANLLLKMGREVILYDGNEKTDREKVKSSLVKEAEIVLGELTDEVIERTDYCVISPGIPLEVPFVEKLKEAGIRILSEIELAFTYEKGRVVGITGTNGKTTTTTLTGDIMKAAYGAENGFAVGNIGVPYAEEVLKTSEKSVSVIELSSFQLETVTSLHPHVSAILNITPDHLNRHHTMEKYAEVKEQICANQTMDDAIVLNYDDARLKAFGDQVKNTRVIYFSGTQVLENGYYLEGDELKMAESGASRTMLRKNDVRLVGQCNYENILAAIAIADAMGVPQETTLEVCRNFRAVPHRIEFVREVDGVRYYNDSKGTNPDAAIQAIKAMTSPTVLIGGGYDKGSEFDEWFEAFDGKIKKLLLMGQTKEKIAECAKKHGFTDYVFVNSMEEAVKMGRELTLSGENVLLSPACASWGMFDNYEQRGDIFKDLVNRM